MPPLLGFYGVPNSNDALFGAGNGAADQNQILLGIHLHDLKTLDGDYLAAGPPGTLAAQEDSGRALGAERTVLR